MVVVQGSSKGAALTILSVFHCGNGALSRLVFSWSKGSSQLWIVQTQDMTRVKALTKPAMHLVVRLFVLYRLI